jgi:hypothetical protein
VSVGSPFGAPSVLKEFTRQLMTYVTYTAGGPGRRYEVSAAGTCVRGPEPTWPRPVAHAAVGRSVTDCPPSTESDGRAVLERFDVERG